MGKRLFFWCFFLIKILMKINLTSGFGNHYKCQTCMISEYKRIDEWVINDFVPTRRWPLAFQLPPHCVFKHNWTLFLKLLKTSDWSMNTIFIWKTTCDFLILRLLNGSTNHSWIISFFPSSTFRDQEFVLTGFIPKCRLVWSPYPR